MAKVEQTREFAVPVHAVLESLRSAEYLAEQMPLGITLDFQRLDGDKLKVNSGIEVAVDLAVLLGDLPTLTAEATASLEYLVGDEAITNFRVFHVDSKSLYAGAY